MMKVAIPTPTCHPKPAPYTHGRYRLSHSSLTCRQWYGSWNPNTRRSEAAARAASTAATASAVDDVRSTLAPSSAARVAVPTPNVAPPAAAPTTNHVAVAPKRWRRVRSASGVMVDSIDWPHGDHVERTAAATASATASTMRTSISTSEP